MSTNVTSQYNEYHAFNTIVERCKESEEKLNGLVFKEPDDKDLGQLNGRIANLGVDYENHKIDLRSIEHNIDEINRLADLFNEYVGDIQVDVSKEPDDEKDEREISAVVQLKPGAYKEVGLSRIREIVENDFEHSSMLPSVDDEDQVGENIADQAEYPIGIFMFDGTDAGGSDFPF